MTRYFKYKGVTVNAFGLPISSLEKKNLNRPQKSKRNYSQYRQFGSSFPLTAPKDMIIILDISSDKRSQRDWLRRQLKEFNYSLLQKNILVGPSPLPPEFINYLKSISLFSRLKMFKLAQPFQK